MMQEGPRKGTGCRAEPFQPHAYSVMRTEKQYTEVPFATNSSLSP